MIDKNEWLKHFRRNKTGTWIIIELTNGSTHFRDHFNGWLEIKRICDDENIFIKRLYLKFRSHLVEIDIKDADGLYLVRSILGKIGGKSKEHYTTGVVKGDKVYKKMWMIPELISERDSEDSIERCFEQAIIYDKTKVHEQK